MQDNDIPSFSFIMSFFTSMFEQKKKKEKRQNLNSLIDSGEMCRFS